MHSTPIVFAFDSSFVKPTAVAISSLLRHSSVSLDIRCICSELSPEAEALIRNVVRGRNSRLTVHRLIDNSFDDWKVASHFTVASYYRLVVPEIISTDRALYLDGDIIVTCDIRPLLDLDLGDKWIAGCFDWMGGRTTAMPKYEGDTYINAGVLLMNLVELRNQDYKNRCKEIYHHWQEQITWADQCLINEFAKFNKLVINENWNIQLSSLDPTLLDWEVARRAGNAIIHASGSVKPWMSWSSIALKNLWLAYANDVFDDAASLIKQPITLKDFSDAVLSYDRQQRWQESSKTKDVIVKYYYDKYQEVLKKVAGD